MGLKIAMDMEWLWRRFEANQASLSHNIGKGDSWGTYNMGSIMDPTGAALLSIIKRLNKSEEELSSVLFVFYNSAAAVN